ncbi:site-specific integrase, partial [Flavobacteriaceae bacterium F89]
MSHSLSLLFYIKKSKADEQGNTNIYLRITLDGRRAECSIRRKVHLSGWNSRTQLALGNSMVAQEINRELGVIK